MEKAGQGLGGSGERGKGETERLMDVSSGLGMAWGSHVYAEAYTKLTQPYANAMEIENSLGYAQAYAKLMRP